MFYARKYHLYRPALSGGRVVAAFTPTQVAGLAYWYDAADLTTLWQDSGRTTPVTADADPVGAWDDKSGNARHVVQATAGSRPTYKTAILNGKAVVRGDGSDDVLDEAVYENDVPAYVTAVVIPRAAGTSLYIHDRVNVNRLTLWADTTNGSYRQGSVSTGTLRGSAASGTAAVVGAAFATGAACFLRVNGSEYAAEDLSADNTGAGIRLFGIGGAAGRGQVDIAELIGYSAVPSAADRAALASYFNTKWAVY